MRKPALTVTTLLLASLLILSSGIVALAGAAPSTPTGSAALFTSVVLPPVNASGFIAPIPPRDPNAQPISTVAQLRAMVDGGNYYLTKDIDLSSYNHGVWQPLMACVKLDGQGHVIRNLRIPASARQRVAGLFGAVLLHSDFTVKNLGIKLHTQGITGYNALPADKSTEYPVFAGGLVAVADNQGVDYAISISNCYVSGDVTGTGSGVNQNVLVGGLAGEFVGTAPISITNCYTTGRVRSTSDRESSGIGGLAGSLGFAFGPDVNVTVDHCYSSCGVSAMNGNTVNYGIDIGGLVGSIKKGTITNSRATGAVSAKASCVNIGGLVGTSDESTVIRSSASGNVSGSTPDSVDKGICIVAAGGLEGLARSNTVPTAISGCFSTGAVNAVATNSSPTAVSTCARAGGLIGELQTGAVTDCYATGAANAASTSIYADAGGVAGSLISGGTATHCFATGHVSATKALGTASESGSVGGIAGGTYKASSITNCYFDSQTTGLAQAIGNDAASAPNAGKTTSQMKAQATYAGWDFSAIWGIGNGRNKGYPYLQRQYIHRVFFDSRGGNAVASQDIKHSATIDAPAAPTRSGYNFTGWYKNAAGTEKWNFATDTVTCDRTLYAGWKAKPKPQTPGSSLSGITLSAGTLKPTFSAKATSYTVNLGENDAAVIITPTKAYDGAAMTIDGKKVSSKTVKLANGKTATVKIKVTWNKKSTTYKLTIKRAKSSDCTLSALKASAGTWSQPFDPKVSSYKLTLPENVGKVTLKALRSTPLATVTPASKTLLLKNGQTVKATFKVKAQSGAVRTYTVLITRAKSSNANLASLKVSGAALTPRFGAGVTSYTVTLPSNTASAVITAKAADPLSKVTINGTKKNVLTLKLAKGKSATVTVTVISQAGVSKSYTVVVSRRQ